MCGVGGHDMVLVTNAGSFCTKCPVRRPGGKLTRIAGRESLGRVLIKKMNQSLWNEQRTDENRC